MKIPWVSGRVIWVVTECSRHDLSIFPKMFGSGSASHPCDSEERPVLLPNHTVYIQLWHEEVLQHIEVAASRNGSIGEKNGL
jgi:hypothetical protein